MFEDELKGIFDLHKNKYSAIIYFINISSLSEK